jgi:hypothetical protein
MFLAMGLNGNQINFFLFLGLPPNQKKQKLFIVSGENNEKT